MAGKSRIMPYIVGLLALILLGVGWAGYSAVNRMAQVTEDLYAHPLAVSNAVLRIHANVISLNRSMKDVILAASPEEIIRYGQEMDQTETEITQDFMLVQKQFLGNPVEVREAVQAYALLRPILDEVIKLRLQGRTQEAVALMQSGGVQRTKDIEFKINKLRDFSREKSQVFLADARETRNQTLWFVLLSLGAGIILAGIISHRAVRLETNMQTQNEHLDAKVQERTRDLAVSNEKLSAQNEEITAQYEEIAAQNEELTSQNEEISAMNEEISSLNQNLSEANEGLEKRVQERTSELSAAHQEITAQYEELLAMQETLGESEARYRAVMEQAPEAVVICDPDTGDLLETNARFTERFGYDLKRDGPLKVFDITEDNPESVWKFLAAVKKDRFLPLQRRLLRQRNGALTQVERSATLIRYRDRSLVALTIRDVSDEVRREQEIQRDAQLAARVQNALLTMAEPSEYLDLSAIYHPFSYVGGDLYFLDWRYHRQVLRGFIVDATGHGLGTALHTSAMHVLLREVNELDLPLADQMRWINRRAVQHFEAGTFAGALGFELDLQLRQLRWVCAGIPEVWLATKSLRGVVAKAGMFLGMNEEELFEMHSLAIEVGDDCYFLTDGLADRLERSQDLPLENYRDMVELLQRLAVDELRRDDATAICLHVRALPMEMVRKDGWPKILRFNGYGDYQRLKGEINEVLAEVTGLAHSIHEVAVNEAVANALECRDGAPREHKARIRFNQVGNRFIVRVKSSRMGFAGNAILRRLRANPDEMFSFGEDAGMGRGIPIMLSTAHRMVYNSEGTEVLLSWKLATAPQNGH